MAKGIPTPVFGGGDFSLFWMLDDITSATVPAICQPVGTDISDPLSVNALVEAAGLTGSSVLAAALFIPDAPGPVSRFSWQTHHAVGFDGLS